MLNNWLYAPDLFVPMTVDYSKHIRIRFTRPNFMVIVLKLRAYIIFKSIKFRLNHSSREKNKKTTQAKILLSCLIQLKSYLSCISFLCVVFFLHRILPVTKEHLIKAVEVNKRMQSVTNTYIYIGIDK